MGALSLLLCASRRTFRVDDNGAMSALPREVDPRGLSFTPYGLGGPMPPAVAVDVLARACELLTPPAAVPQEVRSQFGKVLRLYADGLFTYDNFTIASREAHRVLEVALKVRFLEHYAGGVPLVVNGEPQVRPLGTFEALRPALIKERARLAGYRRFNGSLASLLHWARGERYLYGQRNRVREWATRQIRNYELHSEFNAVHMPPDTVRTLRLVSEMIARLWDADMPSRTVYPGTIERIPMVIGQGPQQMEGTQFALDQLPDVTDELAGKRVWYVVLGNWNEDLMSWVPDIETTTSPVTGLWGPGSWDALHETASLLASTWRPDAVQTVDRDFYVRSHQGAVDYARSAEQVRALRGSLPDERWFVIVADAPGDARNHVHRVLADICKAHGCQCPVTLVYERARRETVVRRARDQAGN